MTTTKSRKPASEQAQSPIAKNTSKTRELSSDWKERTKKLLAEKKVTCLETLLSALATQIAYPELAQKLEQEQGADPSNWTEFGPGLSQANANRWRTGQPVPAHVHNAFCQALSKLCDIVCNPDEMAAPDPKPYFKQLHRANQRRVNATAQGQPLKSPILNRDWAKGSTVTVKAETLFLHPSSEFPVVYTVHVTYRDMQHQVGVVVATPTSELQPFVDGRLYLWTGAEVKNGKKVIQTLRFKGDLDAHVQKLLSLQAPLDIAS